MSKRKRHILKNFFKKGSLPSEEQFGDLVDSMLNMIDEGFDKSPEEGLKIAQIGDEGKLISFYRDIELKSPLWSIEVDKEDKLLYNNESNSTVLFLDPKGKIGLNKKDPEHEFDVDGVISSKGRAGNIRGEIPADGIWHSIIDELEGCQAFEIMAGAGKKDSGKYALLHAFALNTFNPKGRFFNLINSKKGIRCQNAYYHSRCSKLKLRWAGGQSNYSLELKSSTSYGDEVCIRYYITQLWFDEFMERCRKNSNDLSAES